MEKHSLNKFLLSIYLKPHRAILIFMGAAGILLGVYQLFNDNDFLVDALFSGFLIGSFLAYPIAILLIHLVYLIFEIKEVKGIFIWLFDAEAIVFGMILEYFYLGLEKNMTSMDWQEQLYGLNKHTPIYSGAALTVAAIFVVAIIGYIILNYFPLEKLPPLVVVLSMSAMYLGIVQLIVFTVQVFEKGFLKYDLLELYLLILPACCILIAARTILAKVHEWRTITMEKSKIRENAVLNSFDALLNNAVYWPVLALVLALPLLGVLIGILVMCGQAPDAIVKAWTETSDWALSQKISPPNLHPDEHYLCTVAAGGHRKVVKPIRKGIRHDHEVVVNRQLCIANAFEQILEDYTPHFHKAVRGFYDKYGFPVARLIKKQWIADIVYFIMKPLEWLFVLVLYLVDVHPENRIAVQYMGKVPAYRH